ncbi:hypothetical protein HBH98_007870 [Parastagonospora nodorum]|nr:hypothetical protein HBH54_169390 [Parastagonospora nodorum]KAH3982014.1 hypothetical protein HBH52_074850 [Parastagonospora nodorum]KAH4058226.1 hypothetical protein HBH49_030350 [Parastagonospora nodorum]KAH4133477.1 hypothetical protein HBH47_005960 [Parastagonospora nodorum]KAH4133966.1 hypothetical protein HBH45_173110 [Parastagonospora nodorum]
MHVQHLGRTNRFHKTFDGAYRPQISLCGYGIGAGNRYLRALPYLQATPHSRSLRYYPGWLGAWHPTTRKHSRSICNAVDRIFIYQYLEDLDRNPYNAGITAGLLWAQPTLCQQPFDIRKPVGALTPVLPSLTRCCSNSKTHRILALTHQHDSNALLIQQRQ